jgi:peptidoglycan/LPS O-acetylase OafA/YrhL
VSDAPIPRESASPDTVQPPRWPAAFRERVRLLQRLLALLFALIGAVLIYLGTGPLTHDGVAWLTALGAFLLLAGIQAICFGPYYLAWLETHRRAPG